MSTENNTVRQWRAPKTVAELAAGPAWTVERSATTGQWSTAEWRHGSWQIGLTPVRHGVVAAMLWSQDKLVEHTRGGEATICAKVTGWLEEIARTA
ncbi:hypothetical protein AB0383_27700 [Amycolatopsis sp. NPDC051373]|uniref:hypothetical protein n=1 Tax=Amycolatopsis sp. NPDC051373 TaxID=3155801 RepID=UPI00344E63C4